MMCARPNQAKLEICEAWPPDMVLSDWMMPAMNGLEFCHAFKNMPRDGYGYFILLTSKSAKGDVAEGLEGGADDFLSKPVNGVELRARLAAGERIIQMIACGSRFAQSRFDRSEEVATITGARKA